jgi:hypothetical protein
MLTKVGEVEMANRHLLEYFGSQQLVKEPIGGKSAGPGLDKNIDDTLF